MNNKTIINNDEIEITNLFISEILEAYNLVLTKGTIRKIGPLHIDEIIWKLEVLANDCKTLTPKDIVKIKRLNTLFHILVKCIINDSKYKEEFLNYKKTL